jgi:hypothetical protein
MQEGETRRLPAGTGKACQWPDLEKCVSDIILN